MPLGRGYTVSDALNPPCGGVIQDGFNPNMNMRFPRSIREDGKLYVVENVTTAADGKSYTAHGSIKRLV